MDDVFHRPYGELGGAAVGRTPSPVGDRQVRSKDLRDEIKAASGERSLDEAFASPENIEPT